ATTMESTGDNAESGSLALSPSAAQDQEPSAAVLPTPSYDSDLPTVSCLPNSEFPGPAESAAGTPPSSPDLPVVTQFTDSKFHGPAMSAATLTSHTTVSYGLNNATSSYIFPFNFDETAPPAHTISSLENISYAATTSDNLPMTHAT
ncbi:hypothetical protein GTQ34_16615, partial [Muricauda sp. JGD-17]